MLKIDRHMIAVNAFALLGACTLFLFTPSSAHAAAPAAKSAATATAKASASDDLLSAPKSLGINVKEAMQDRVLGNPNAPVTITEYASLTCPHCAHFDTEILPKVKKQLIDTGKAKLIYRDFPLDKFALKAAMMARCVSPMKYFNMIDVIFTNQDRWIKAKDPMAALAQLGSLAGMDASQFKACTSDMALQTAIMKRMQQAETKYKIDATPTFIFNGGAAKIRGAYPVTKFEEIVASLTKGK